MISIVGWLWWTFHPKTLLYGWLENLFLESFFYSRHCYHLFTYNNLDVAKSRSIIRSSWCSKACYTKGMFQFKEVGGSEEAWSKIFFLLVSGWTAELGDDTYPLPHFHPLESKQPRNVNTSYCTRLARTWFHASQSYSREITEPQQSLETLLERNRFNLREISNPPTEIKQTDSIEWCHTKRLMH